MREIRPTRRRPRPEPWKLDRQNTLNLTLSVEISGNELFLDRAGTIEQTVARFADMCCEQLAVVSIVDGG